MYVNIICTVVSQVSSKASDPREHYLGLLYPSEDYKMYFVIITWCSKHCWNFSYGYATNSRMKFIIVTENLSSQSKDQEMKQVLKLHKYTG